MAATSSLVVDASVAIKWFVTGDQRLFNALRDTKPFVRHIADWKPPTADEEIAPAATA